jgi:hypothetical protein
MPRKDLIRTTATFNGQPAGEFRTFSGGDATWEDRKTTNGAGHIERARGGRKKVSNVTIVREDDGTFDFHALAQARHVSMTVTRQPLDDDGNPRGKAWTYTGKAVRVAPGEGDAESDTDGDDVTVEMSCDGMIV